MHRQRQKVRRQMREVTADPGPLHEDVVGRLGRASGLVIEPDVGVHPVADGLDPRPTLRRPAEEAPGDLREPIHLAIAAAEQIDQGLGGQLLGGVLPRPRDDRVGLTGVLNDHVIPEAQRPRRREDPSAPVAEAVSELLDRDVRLHNHPGVSPHRALAIGVQREHHQHRRRGLQLKDKLIADSHVHWAIPPTPETLCLDATILLFAIRQRIV